MYAIEIHSLFENSYLWLVHIYSCYDFIKYVSYIFLVKVWPKREEKEVGRPVENSPWLIIGWVLIRKEKETFFSGLVLLSLQGMRAPLSGLPALLRWGLCLPVFTTLIPFMRAPSLWVTPSHLLKTPSFENFILGIRISTYMLGVGDICNYNYQCNYTGTLRLSESTI